MHWLYTPPQKKIKRENTPEEKSFAPKTPATSTIARPQSPDLPNFDNINLLEMETIDDKMLMEVLKQMEKQIQEEERSKTQEQPKSVDYTQNVNQVMPMQNQNTTNSVTTINNAPIPVAARMFFQNSNVTINYNISK